MSPTPFQFKKSLKITVTFPWRSWKITSDYYYTCLHQEAWLSERLSLWSSCGDYRDGSSKPTNLVNAGYLQGELKNSGVCACGGRRTTFRGCFSPSRCGVWIELRLYSLSHLARLKTCTLQPKIRHNGVINRLNWQHRKLRRKQQQKGMHSKRKLVRTEGIPFLSSYRIGTGNSGDIWMSQQFNPCIPL